MDKWTRFMGLILRFKIIHMKQPIKMDLWREDCLVHSCAKRTMRATCSSPIVVMIVCCCSQLIACGTMSHQVVVLSIHRVQCGWTGVFMSAIVVIDPSPCSNDHICTVYLNKITKWFSDMVRCIRKHLSFKFWPISRWNYVCKAIAIPLSLCKNS